MKIDELTNLTLLTFLSNKIFNSSKDIINIQNLFREFVDWLYGYDNNKNIYSLTLTQKFYIFYDKHQDESQAFSERYRYYGLFNFNYVPSSLIHLKPNNTSKLILKLKLFNTDGSKIFNSYSIVIYNIYTILYISLFQLYPKFLHLLAILPNYKF